MGKCKQSDFRCDRQSKETDAELRNRVYSSYAINSTGSVESLESNLAQLSGVIDVAVLENYTNNPVTKYGVGVHSHSIAVCISGGEDNDIASVIYARKDVGCGTTGSYSVTYIDTNHSDVTYTYKINKTDKYRLLYQLIVIY